MAPINLPDGTEVSEVILPGGATASEVIAPDGSVVLSAIPDSVVFNVKARDYDGSKYVANIGPDLPDAQGDPTTTTVSIGGESFTAVRYDNANSDASQTTTQIATGDPIALVYSVANRSPNTAPQHYLDTDGDDDFAHLFQTDSGEPHRILSNAFNVDVRGDDADSAFHTFAYVIGSSNGGTLDRDGTTILSDGSASDPSLGGFTLGSRGDFANHADLDVLEVSALENPSSSEIADEVSRQRSEYNI